MTSTNKKKKKKKKNNHLASTRYLYTKKKWELTLINSQFLCSKKNVLMCIADTSSFLKDCRCFLGNLRSVVPDTNFHIASLRYKPGILALQILIAAPRPQCRRSMRLLHTNMASITNYPWRVSSGRGMADLTIVDRIWRVRPWVCPSLWDASQHLLQDHIGLIIK